MMDHATDRERTRLYLITPPIIDDVSAFQEQLQFALAGGDVAALQIRLKDEIGRINRAATKAVGLAVKEALAARDIALIINDDAELAAEIGADGVHLGHEDTPIKAAREIVGPDVIVGATAKNSKHTAMVAGEAGADYVAFGAFYPTSTKADTVQATPDLLEFWQQSMSLPCVAIGGITPATSEFIARAGADFIAVSSSVWRHDDGPEKAVAEFNAAIDRAFAD